MKKIASLLSLVLCFSLVLEAQKLPVRTATVFKNGRSLLFKSGKVPAQSSRWTAKELPDALFGTFWVSGEVQSVFAVQDSVEKASPEISKNDLLKKNVGKSLKLILFGNGAPGQEVVEGTLEQTFGTPQMDMSLLVKTPAGRWVALASSRVERIEFPDKPDFEVRKKVAERRLEVNFKNNKPEQDVELAYLTGNLGWTPIYKLDLTEKNRGRLALRAEIVNDAEDLGDSELRLAVGVPNFAYATRPAHLFNFGSAASHDGNFDFDMNVFRGNAFANQRTNQASFYDLQEVQSRPNEGDEGNFEGSQAEDFFFYSIRPGNFPRNSRFQYPIFEAEVVPLHFYECILQTATPETFTAYKQPGSRNEAKNSVSHFIEFPNPTKFPWTTGAVNIASQSSAGLQPVSQDMLPYTSAGGKCKVKIAQTPEIKVTHAEGDVDREENARKFFSVTYDRVRIEGQVCAANYKNETVTLKIRRNIEGMPGQSEQKWKTTQEQATLRVNPAFVAEWEIELKPGEEKKWKYSYDVFVNY